MISLYKLISGSCLAVMVLAGVQTASVAAMPSNYNFTETAISGIDKNHNDKNDKKNQKDDRNDESYHKEDNDQRDKNHQDEHESKCQDSQPTPMFKNMPHQKCKADIIATAVCGPNGVTVTLTNRGNADGVATVNGGVVAVKAGSTNTVTIPLDQMLQARVEIKFNGKVIYCQTLTCTNMGGGSAEPPATTTADVPIVTPVATTLPNALPSTGPGTNTALLVLLLGMITVYGAVYYGRLHLQAARVL